MGIRQQRIYPERQPNAILAYLGKTMLYELETPPMMPQSPSVNCEVEITRRRPGRCVSLPSAISYSSSGDIRLVSILSTTLECKNLNLTLSSRTSRTRVIVPDHPAKPGAAEEAYGSLRIAFPELGDVSAEEVIRDLQRSRNRE
jgi:hypothetical protein